MRKQFIILMIFISYFTSYVCASFSSEKIIGDIRVSIEWNQGLLGLPMVNQLYIKQETSLSDKNLEKANIIGQGSKNNYLRNNDSEKKVFLLLEVELMHENQQDNKIGLNEYQSQQESLTSNKKLNELNNIFSSDSKKKHLNIFVISNQSNINAYQLAQINKPNKKDQEEIKINPDYGNLLIEISCSGQTSSVKIQPQFEEARIITGVQFVNAFHLEELPENLDCSKSQGICWVIDHINSKEKATSNYQSLQRLSLPYGNLGITDDSSITPPNQPSVIIPRQLLASSNIHFSLSTSGKNEVTVTVLQPFLFLLPMQEVFTIEVGNLQYDRVMYIKNYAYVTYKFQFTQLVPSTATAIFTLKYPLKMQPNPTDLSQLSITFESSFEEDVSATQISSIFTKTVKYAIVVSNYAFIIAMFFQKSHTLQSVIFVQQVQQQLTSYNEFPASDPLRDYFEQIYSSHFNINPYSPTGFYTGKRYLQEQSNPARVLLTTNQFYPQNEQLTLTSLEVNSGFYALLAIAAIIGIVACFFAIFQRFRHWLEEIKIVFRFQVFLAIIFLCYFGTCEDAIYRLYHSVYSSSMEKIINYILLGFIALHPIYMIPIVFFCEKENHQSNVGMFPFSFYYMNVLINSKRHFVLLVPFRLLFIFLSAVIRVIWMSALPYFLIGQHIFLILYMLRYRPHRVYHEYLLDMINSCSNIIQVIILIVVARQDLFKESIRSGISQGFVYLSVLLIGFNVGFIIYRVVKTYQFYRYEKDFEKKIMPVETYMPQTRAGYTLQQAIITGPKKDKTESKQLQMTSKVYPENTNQVVSNGEVIPMVDKNKNSTNNITKIQDLDSVREGGSERSLTPNGHVASNQRPFSGTQMFSERSENGIQ